MKDTNFDKMNDFDLQNTLFYRVLAVDRYGADGNLLGNPLIAESKYGDLVYVLDPKFDEFYISASIDMLDRLNEILKIVKTCMARKDKFTKYQLHSIYESMCKTQGSAISKGYFRHAEELTKLLYKEFEVVPKDQLKDIIKGYAFRQIMRGVDCSKDVERVMSDIENKEYGLMPQIENRYEQENLRSKYYNKATITLVEPVKKWYGLRYGYKIYGMEDYNKAIKAQKNLIESVATM